MYKQTRTRQAPSLFPLKNNMNKSGNDNTSLARSSTMKRNLSNLDLNSNSDRNSSKRLRKHKSDDSIIEDFEDFIEDDDVMRDYERENEHIDEILSDNDTLDDDTIVSTTTVVTKFTKKKSKLPKTSLKDDNQFNSFKKSKTKSLLNILNERLIRATMTAEFIDQFKTFSVSVRQIRQPWVSFCYLIFFYSTKKFLRCTMILRCTIC